MNIKSYIDEICRDAKKASGELAQIPTKIKNECLLAMADRIDESFDDIEKANLKDLGEGKKNGLSKAMLDRLNLDIKRIRLMSEGLRHVAKLPDPVGEVMDSWRRPNGMKIEKIRVPIGVIAIIYESRPNVTVDAAGLCFKSGNAVILRGGSEALYTNLELIRIMKAVLSKAGVNRDAIQLVDVTDRKAIIQLLKMDQVIDLVMPRGGEGLIRTVAAHTSIPVIKHYKGVCHVYVDSSADLKMAEEIILNAKVQRPGVCNSIETLLIHKDLRRTFLPKILQILKDQGVEIRGCSETRKIVKGIKEAKEEDWYTEYLDLILSVKVVKGLHEAIEHINHYGSKHSDSIVTQEPEHAKEFLSKVDSACVYHNVSTRFTDGFEFGFGAEIGISTDKIHARGPMGLRELTSYKFVIRGKGQLRG